MHTTLAILLAAGHLATAYESQFSYSPRATTSDDNLATITTLVDGHLPTCFTNHPTHPCPTDGPAVVERDAPLKVANKDYIPQPSEWAIPSNFTFTDTISNSTTSTAPTTVSLTAYSSKESTTASATATPHSDSYLKSNSNYFNRGDTYAKRLNASALIESMIHDGAPKPTGSSAARVLLPTGDELPQSSNATSTSIASPTGYTTALPSVSSQLQNSLNASSNAHLTGTIGTLLSQAMFPGKMRAPTTTTSHESAPTTTKAPSTEHIVPIPMSQRPNTTAPDATLQAFVHTINTDELAASQQSASSSTVSQASASATPVIEKSEETHKDYKIAASSSTTVQQATEASTEAKQGEKLHHYHHSVISKESSTTYETPTTSSPISFVEVTPVPTANGNDTQAVTLINSNRSATLIEAQPTAAPKAYAQAHHHPRARRFIS